MRMNSLFPGRTRPSRRPDSPATRRHAPPRRSSVPRLEVLEDRTVLSMLTVTSGADSGSGTLRQAILDASDGDTIKFAPNVHAITLTSGELQITKSLDIEGPGAHRLTISGNDASRVFDISGAVTVTLAGLTIAHGKAIGVSGSTDPQGGGGILNEAGATLYLTRSSLVNNQATAASAMDDVFGGGLLNEGSAVVASSTFIGNQALGGGGGSFFGGSVGGAIDNFGGATLTVSDSTFVANQVNGAAGPNFGIGGAIENNAGFDNTNPSMANISNSIFINNLATGGDGSTGNGGAIDNEGSGATMNLTHSTLIGNQSIGGPRGNGVRYLECPRGYAHRHQ
jgi:hypothetical protein